MTDNPDETLPVELLPCPFCNDPMRIRADTLQHCEQGRCPIGAYAWGSTPKTIAAWNRRATQSPPPVVSEGIERDIRIAIWNAGKWQGKPDEVAQSLIRKAMAEPTMIRALAALSSPSRGCDAETIEACASETGWLIERDPDGAMCLTYADAIGWVYDPERALRFAREKDARAFIEAQGWKFTRIAEHRWG